MSKTLTPEEILDLSLDPRNDSRQTTVRGYLTRLLLEVWREGEEFSGKKPFGNSDWQYDLYLPLIQAGALVGHVGSGEWGPFVEELAHDQVRKGDTLIADAIAALDPEGVGQQ
jgi:hypothetical protein